MPLHQHYDQLTPKERDFVDEVFSDCYPLARQYGVNLSGMDPAERAVDAFAKFVMDSRPKPLRLVPKFRPPVRIPRPTPTEAEKAQALEDDRNAFDKWAADARP